MRRFTIFEIALLLPGIFVVYYTATREISIKTDFVPTVINGLTSSISVIVAFTGALITLVLSGSIFNFSASEKRTRIMPTIVMLGVPLALLWTSYSYLLDANYDGALKVAMIGLLISLQVFMDFMGFLTSRFSTSQEIGGNKAKD